MTTNDRQPVYKVKDKLSSDRRCAVHHNQPMPKTASKARYKAEFLKRTQSIRMSTGLTQAEFARALGCSKDVWVKYETRSIIPHHLIPELCELTGHDAWYVLTGQPASSAPTLGKLSPRR